MAWSVDRLGRSLQDLVGFLSELHALGIDLFLHQQGLDTTTPAGKAMFQMMGVFAEFERAMIQERVRAGLARAPSWNSASGGLWRLLEGPACARSPSSLGLILARCSGSAALTLSRTAPQASPCSGRVRRHQARITEERVTGDERRVSPYRRAIEFWKARAGRPGHIFHRRCDFAPRHSSSSDGGGDCGDDVSPTDNCPAMMTTAAFECALDLKGQNARARGRHAVHASSARIHLADLRFPY
jgi:hypothetical protein